MATASKMLPLDAFDYRGKTVILRIDINSPINPESGRIVNDNRINKSLPTLTRLLDAGAKLAVIAHQGNTLDYQNLVPMREHAELLAEKLGRPVGYIDDVAGPAACEAVRNLEAGEAVLLGNLRYLCEEISTFENAVKLRPEEMLNTYLVRNLAPLADFYVNDAFAAAHRNAPSMVAFQELLPSAAGPLLMGEVEALTRVLESPARPAVFVLGGAKISDAYGMMRTVLENGSADRILACGVTGLVMLVAQGRDVGAKTKAFIEERSLDVFIEPSREYLAQYPDRMLVPTDLAFEDGGSRREIAVEDLPRDEHFLDIGAKTVAAFSGEIAAAGTIFFNGPPGVYEKPLFEAGTKGILGAIAAADGYSVIGGGDTVTATQKYLGAGDVDYVCTAGGAMVRFLSSTRLPLLVAMEKAGG
ncbi:MAG: phosphoglycerate kinase [Planctomycetota bacterium]|jgi:phosphoglycerate kinase